MARDPAITSRIMRSIKRRDTTPELLLRKSLHKLGVRYRVASRKVYGKPDISIVKYKLAIFVDGDFWHGNEHKLRGLSRLEDLFPTNSLLWCRKILGNIERDQRVSQCLEDEGWTVIRIWASTILLNPDEPAQSIQKALTKLKSNNVSAATLKDHSS
jgi:DNA mismatch endonuclease (patch repair protein)